MDERTIHVDVGVGTLEVSYDRDALGRAYAETAQGFAVGTSKKPWSFPAGPFAKSRATVAALAEVITAWDLVEDDGRPIQPSVAVLVQLPLYLLNSIHYAIDEDAFGPN